MNNKDGISCVSDARLNLLQNSDKLRDELSIVIRWRILTAKGGKTRIIAYQDARDVQKVLDYVCGIKNWANEPMNINGKLYMSISINTEEGWVSKADVGTETAIEKTKGEASDALKRAAVMWGIFRDIYEYDYVVLDHDGKYPLTPDGIQLKTPLAISIYCNGISEPMNHLRMLYLKMKNKLEGNDRAIQAMTVLKTFINEQKN